MKSNYRNKEAYKELDKKTMRNKFDELREEGHSLGEILSYLSSKIFLKSKRFHDSNAAREALMEIFQEQLIINIEAGIDNFIKKLSRGQILLIIQGIDNLVEKALNVKKSMNIDADIIEELKEYVAKYVADELEKYYQEHPDDRIQDEETAEADKVCHVQIEQEKEKGKMQAYYDDLILRYQPREVLSKLASSEFLIGNFKYAEIAKGKLVEIYEQYLAGKIEDIVNAHLKGGVSRAKTLTLLQGVPDVVEQDLGRGKVDSSIIEELQTYFDSYIAEELEKIYQEHPEGQQEVEDSIRQDEKLDELARKQRELRKQGLDFYTETKKFTSNFSFLAESDMMIDADGVRSIRPKFSRTENGLKFMELQTKVTDIMSKYSIGEQEAIRILVFPESAEYTESKKKTGKTIKIGDLPTIDGEEMEVLSERLVVLSVIQVIDNVKLELSVDEIIAIKLIIEAMWSHKTTITVGQKLTTVPKMNSQEVAYLEQRLEEIERAKKAVEER